MFFFITKKNKPVLFYFSITQHYQDKDLFSIITNYLSYNIIEEVSTRYNIMNLVVSRLEDILKIIIPIFK